MQPISALSLAEARRIDGILFDLDDTALDHGALTRDTFEALEQLSDSRLLVVGVTGRPAAWGQALIRQWPVDGMVTENGIISFSKITGRVARHDRRAPEERRRIAARLQALLVQLQQQWPELVPSDDGIGRMGDLALDIGESRTIPQPVIEAATAFARRRGAWVVASSIHLHLSFDPEDKATGTLRFLREAFDIDPGQARWSMMFIGDSGNDAPAFAAFHTTVGVHNLVGRFTLAPRYITEGPRSAGFREAVETLLQRRFVTR